MVSEECTYNLTCWEPWVNMVTTNCSSISPHSFSVSILTGSIVLGALILCLNVIILYTSRKKYCRTPINALVYGLCVEDLLTALVIIPLFVVTFISHKVFLSPWCNIYGMAVVFMSLTSGSTVCLICMLQTYAYLKPLAFRCHIRTIHIKISSFVRYVLMFIFVLPFLLKKEFYFQYDETGHMCNWNANGHIGSYNADTMNFNYLKFATWFYPLCGMLQVVLMVSSVALALYLVSKARYIEKRRKIRSDLSSGSGRKSPNLWEGFLLSLSYLIGISFLMISQINDYLVPPSHQIQFMLVCSEWNLFKTISIFITSFMNQFAIGLKNRRIRNQLAIDLNIVGNYADMRRRFSRTLSMRLDTTMRLDTSAFTSVL